MIVKAQFIMGPNVLKIAAIGADIYALLAYTLRALFRKSRCGPAQHNGWREYTLTVVVCDGILGAMLACLR